MRSNGHRCIIVPRNNTFDVMIACYHSPSAFRVVELVGNAENYWNASLLMRSKETKERMRVLDKELNDAR